MGYKKSDLIFLIKKQKKVIKLLKKLQLLCWVTNTFTVWEEIENEKKLLEIYKEKLKNGDYV